MCVRVVCSCDISVYGALKRLHEWNDASVHVMSAAEVDDVPPTFAAWSNSLHASVMKAECAVNGLPLWHGHVMVYGSEVGVVVALIDSVIFIALMVSAMLSGALTLLAGW